MPPIFDWVDVSAAVPDVATWSAHSLIYGDYFIETYSTIDHLIHLRAIHNPTGGTPSVDASASFAHNLKSVEHDDADLGVYRLDATRFLVLWSGHGTNAPPTTGSPLRARLITWDGATFTVGAQLDNIAIPVDYLHPIFAFMAVKMADERICIGYTRFVEIGTGAATPQKMYAQVLGINADSSLGVLAAETLLYTGPVSSSFPPLTELGIYNEATSADYESEYTGWQRAGDHVFSGAYLLNPNSGRQMTLHVDPVASTVTVVTEEPLTTPPIKMLVPIDATHYLGVMDAFGETEPFDTYTFQVFIHDGVRLVPVGTPAVWSTPTNAFANNSEGLPGSYGGGWGFMVNTYSNDAVDFTNQNLFWFQLTVDGGYNLALTVTDITGQAKDSLGNPASVADAAGYLAWPDGRGMVLADWADAPDYSNDTATVWWAAPGVVPIPPTISVGRSGVRFVRQRPL